MGSGCAVAWPHQCIWFHIPYTSGAPERGRVPSNNMELIVDYYDRFNLRFTFWVSHIWLAPTGEKGHHWIHPLTSWPRPLTSAEVEFRGPTIKSGVRKSSIIIDDTTTTSDQADGSSGTWMLWVKIGFGIKWQNRGADTSPRQIYYNKVSKDYSTGNVLTIGILKAVTAEEGIQGVHVQTKSSPESREEQIPGVSEAEEAKKWTTTGSGENRRLWTGWIFGSWLKRFKKHSNNSLQQRDKRGGTGSRRKWELVLRSFTRARQKRSGYRVHREDGDRWWTSEAQRSKTPNEPKYYHWWYVQDNYWSANCAGPHIKTYLEDCEEKLNKIFKRNYLKWQRYWKTCWTKFNVQYFNQTSRLQTFNPLNLFPQVWECPALLEWDLLLRGPLGTQVHQVGSHRHSSDSETAWENNRK